VLAVATSIDALAVGLSLAFLNVSILEPAIIIGIVAFSMTLIGVYIGKKFKNFLGKKMGIAGGLILILIGIKILLEHLVI
jgi:putative Mn2+ efflux pump MntP